MANVIPSEQITDGLELQADSVIDLYEIQLVAGGSIFFKNKNTLTWLGNQYVGLPLKFQPAEKTLEGKQDRPSLAIGQVDSIFTPFLYQGHIDGSLLFHYRVLGQHILSNTDVRNTQVWFISQVPNYTPDLITMRLRRISDGPNHTVPARQYIAPEFPSVSF